MFRKTMVLFLVCFMGLIQPAVPAGAKETGCVEIFDPKQNKVVKEVKLTREIENMVTGWLAHPGEIVAKLNPMPDDGYVLRVPLQPTPALRNKWLYADIDEVFIVIPANEPPFYVILGDDGMSCYLVNGDISMLSEALNFKLDAPR